MRKRFLLAAVIGFSLLNACSSGKAPKSPIPTIVAATTDTPKPETTAMPTATSTALPQALTQPEMPFQICCPLEDETIQSLQLIIIKPLDIPPFGQDTGHHGVDFAYFSRGERESIQGIEIYTVLTGKVVLILEDDYPYGYTVLIETLLSDLPESLQDNLLANYLPVPEDPVYRLYCPDVTPPTLTGEYSIYHLYAHMEELPALKPGDVVSCGERLGTVGSTGWSSNPHLHLETRLGPSSAVFQTMGHYQNTCTVEQMSNYCLWRLSGYYQLFDPFLILDAGGFKR